MKKILFLAITASLAFASPSFAQKGKAKKWKKHKTEQNDRRWDKDDRWDDDDHWDRNDNDRRYERNRRNDNRYDKRYSNNNAPRKVRDAFNSDFPNAKNVQWTKQRGYWTASFRNGIFNSNRTVSYAANGRRVNNNNVFANNQRRNSNIFNAF